MKAFTPLDHLHAYALGVALESPTTATTEDELRRRNQLLRAAAEYERKRADQAEALLKARISEAAMRLLDENGDRWVSERDYDAEVSRADRAECTLRMVLAERRMVDRFWLAVAAGFVVLVVGLRLVIH